MSRYSLICKSVFACLLLTLGASPAAFAQVAQISETVPAESFLGEQFCFVTRLENTGSPGFGPYLRVEYPTDIVGNSASFFSFGTADLVTDLGQFPDLPNNEIIDPNIDEPVTGTPGNRLLLITLPIGAVVENGPPLDIEICATIETDAVLGAPLPVNITPVYEFGNTPTGANGPIIGGTVNQAVTPTVLRLAKTNTAPETERPPGALWPYDYTLDIDFATGAGFNSLQITDTLPPQFQFDGTLVISGGASCTEVQTPSLLVPGGNLELACTDLPVGTAGPGDLTVTYSGYITDVLNELACEQQTLTNAANASAFYQPADGPAVEVTAEEATNDVIARHFAVQKSVNPASVSPGSTPVYTLEMQVTEFSSLSSLVVVDTVADGIDFVSHANLTINASTVAITPTVAVNGDFTKTVSYDITAAFGPIPAGSSLSLSYNTLVRDDYQATGRPILAGDSIAAPVRVDYQLPGSGACNEGSAAAVGVVPVQVTKELLNPQPVYRPGDIAVFRLTQNIPAGSSDGIIFTDFLPIPAFFVAGLDTSTDIDGGSTTLSRGPADTAGLTPTNVSINPAQNSITIQWPDVNSNQPRVIQVDLAVAVSDSPFADGLFLTNILATSNDNTQGEPIFSETIDSVTIGAPSLSITKGVAATDGAGVIAPAPAVLPVDGNISGADGSDSISFVITVENSGNAQAYDVRVTDPGVPGILEGCNATSVVNGNDDALAFTGTITSGLQLTDPLNFTDGTPGAPFSDDTALITVNCLVSATVPPNSSFTNTASLTWAALPGATPFPVQTDDAEGSTRPTAIAKRFIASSEPGTSNTLTPPRATIGEVVRYRLVLEIPEGRIANLSLLDRLPGSLQFLNDGSATMAFVSNGDGIESDGVPGIPNLTGNASDVVSVPSASITFPVPAGAITPATFAPGTDPTFTLGNVTNRDSDTDAEFLVLELNAVMVNVDNVNRDNTFAAFSGDSDLNGNAAAVRVRLAEPQLTVTKTAAPTIGDAGDVIDFTITVRNSSGNNFSPAYDATLSDNLVPLALSGVTGLTVAAQVPANCSNLVITDSTAGDDIALAFSEISPGCVVVVTYSATLNADVAAGTSVVNTADVEWTSLPGTNGTPVGNPGNLTGSGTPGAPGSATGERNGSGGVNDYSREAEATITIPGVGLVKSVVATSEDDASSNIAQHRPTVTDLLIGEQATFEIVATLPEGVTSSLVITDTLPFTNGVMRMDSARVLSEGAQLDVEFSFPAGVISNAQLVADGIDDTVTFNFGEVTNVADGLANENDQVVIEVVATLVNVAANSNGDQLTNTVTAQFGSGLDAVATTPLDVVEPELNVIKSGDIAQGDAGDTVTYTVTISHAGSSTAPAHDLTLEDILPPDVALDLASITVTDGPAFLVNSSAGNTLALGWTLLALDESIELQYQALLLDSVMPGQNLNNRADLEWTSTAGENDDERVTSDSDGHVVIVTAPGVAKVVAATSLDGTGQEQFGDPDDLTIGEEVTYRVTVQIPEGTSTAAQVVDQLPTGSSVLEVVSSRLVSIGGQLTGINSQVTGINLQSLLNAPGAESDSDDDLVNDRVTWLLGDILNSPDGVQDDGDLLVFEVVAVVLDLPANQSGVVDQLNVATIESSLSSGSGSAPVDLVAPALALDKSVVTPGDGFVDAGDTVTMRLELAHTDNSTALAFGIVIDDLLPSGLSWVDDATVSTDCPALVTNSTLAPDLQFSFDELTLTDDACFIEYDLRVDDDVQPGQTLQNSAMLTFDSNPVFVDGRTRRGMSSDTASVMVEEPMLVKEVVETSEPDTMLEQGDPTLFDLTIGETVTYQLTLVLPEGFTPNVVMSDTMPASLDGVIEVIGATVTALGGQLSTSEPGTPVYDDLFLGDGLDDTVVLDFGDITNLEDGNSDEGDRLVVQIVGRVVDVPQNVDGVVLANNAVVTTDVIDLQASVDVEVVEPSLSVDKSMTLRSDGTVRIVLEVENTGTAPAYDLEMDDVLDDSDWLLSGFAEVSVSNGFLLEVLPDTPAAGQQTVRFRTNPLAASPAGSVPVGSSVTASFDVPLAVLPPDPNPLPNTATLTTADTLPGDDPAARALGPLDAEDSIALPQLQLLKTAALLVDPADVGVANPGETLRYTLVLNNIGAAPATTIVITDVPDENSTLVAGSVTTTAGSVSVGNTAGDESIEVMIDTLANDGSVTITYDTLIDNPLATGVEQVVNQAMVDSFELPPSLSDDPDDPTGDMDPTVVPIVAQPDLTLLKSDGGARAVPGGLIVWALSYDNVGNQQADNVTIEDTVPLNSSFDAAASSAGWACSPDNLPGALCTLSRGDVAVGAAGSVNFAVRVDATVPAAVEQISNTAVIADDGLNGADPTPENNQASDDTPLDAVPDLVITKDDGNAVAVPGELLAWTLQVSNVGLQGASGVTVSDTVPANTTFAVGASTAGWNCLPDVNPGSVCTIGIGTLEPGDLTTLAFVVRVNATLDAGVRSIDNSASVTDDGDNGADANPENNRDGDSAPVGSSINLAISKDDGGVRVEPADVLVYTLSYNNLGNQGVSGATITETVPLNTRFDAGASTSGWVCVPDANAGSSCTFALGILAAGAQGTVNFAVLIDETLPETVTAIFNSVSIADDGSNGADIDPSDNQAVETTPADVEVELGLVKSLSDAPDPIAVGDTIEFTLVATNLGNTVLTNVVVSDDLITPTGGTTPCARLEPGQTCTLIGTYQVQLEDMDEGRIDNTGTADSEQTEAIDDLLTVPLLQTPALSLVKTATLQDTNDNGLGNNNEVVEYTLVALNGGNTTLIDVVISDPLLPVLSCIPAQPAVLLPGESLICTGEYKLRFPDLKEPFLVNQAVVTGDTRLGERLEDDDQAEIPLDVLLVLNVPVMSLPAIVLLLMLLLMAGAAASRRLHR